MSGTGSKASGPRRPRRALRTRLLIAGSAAVAGLLLLEGTVRARHYLKHGSFGSVFLDVVDPQTGLRLPAPNQAGRIATDSRGFRSPEPEVPKPAGRIRIAFLGGSTTFCAEVSGNDATWPSLVWQAVREAHPDREFDYVNASATGFATEHSLKQLRHRVAPLEPDVLVVCHATNDLTLDSRALAIEQGIFEVGKESALERWSMAWSLIKKNFLLGESADAASESARVHLDFDPRELARRFEERLTELVSAGQGIARVVAVATFSHRARRDQSPAERRAACQSARYYMPFLTPDDILESIAAYNDAIRRVAAATGAVLIDGEDTIPADAEHFNDSVHLRDAGCRKMADRVAAALIDSGALAPLLR